MDDSALVGGWLLTNESYLVLHALRDLTDHPAAMSFARLLVMPYEDFSEEHGLLDAGCKVRVAIQITGQEESPCVEALMRDYVEMHDYYWEGDNDVIYYIDSADVLLVEGRENHTLIVLEADVTTNILER